MGYFSHQATDNSSTMQLPHSIISNFSGFHTVIDGLSDTADASFQTLMVTQLNRIFMDYKNIARCFDETKIMLDATHFGDTTGHTRKARSQKCKH